MIREKDFVLRPYTKKELAIRFFPHSALSPVRGLRIPQAPPNGSRHER